MAKSPNTSVQRIGISLLKFVIAVEFILIGCSSNNGTYSAEGHAQKGPFVNGSTVTVNELNNSLIATGRVFNTTIVDDQGSFELEDVELETSITKLSVDGFYFNEVSGSLSEARIELWTISELSDNTTINVNILGHLERPRVEYLISQGMGFGSAKSQAQQEVLSIFEIDNSNVASSESLDITRGNIDDSILLAISIILQGQRSTAQLTELLSNISTDLQEDGTLNEMSVGTALVDSAILLNLPQVRHNLENRYETLGVDATIGDFEIHVNQFISNTQFDPSNADLDVDTDTDNDTDIDSDSDSDSDSDTDTTESVEIDWPKHIMEGDYDAATSVHAGDLDGDGDLDIIGSTYEPGHLVWWENTDGSGSQWTEHVFDGYTSGNARAVDMDGDGDLDILDILGWWENSVGDASSWTEHIFSDIYWESANSIFAQDIDGDGDLDVVISNDEFAIFWYENLEGNGLTWSENHTVAYLDGARSVLCADVDGDGDIDVLGAGSLVNTVVWWENSEGNGTVWVEHSVDSDFEYPWSIYAADVDGDQDLDIMGAAWLGNRLSWWENSDSNGTEWIEHTLSSNFLYTTSVYAADIDGDGDADIVGGSDNEVRIWQNLEGDGSQWNQYTVDNDFNGPTSIYLTDLDGDDDIDILGSAMVNDITWWENTGLPE